jgi:hypothetical protein
MVLIEGVSARQLFELPDAELDVLLLTKEPIVFALGSARVLGRARLEARRLVVELGHIDGGGEGVLRALWLLARAYARRRGIGQVEWLVHAVTCTRPNLKLRRVLETRGFTVQEVVGVGAVYRFVDAIDGKQVAAPGAA